MGCRVFFAALVATAVLLPFDLRAQVFEVTPHFGMYTPVGLLVKGVDATDESRFQRRQLGGVMIGGRMALRTNHTFGLEASAAFAPAQVAITDRSRTVDLGGSVTFASVRSVVRVHGSVKGGEWSFHLGPGAGVVHRAGAAWDQTNGATDGALVLTGGGRLGRLNSGKAFRFDVEDYVTRAAFHDGTVLSEARVHHDVIWSFGMSIPLTR
jgi:hypothetical protein